MPSLYFGDDFLRRSVSDFYIMGIGAARFQKVFGEENMREESDTFEIADDNGYVLCNNYYIPEEVLSIILSYVPPMELVFICRRVCKNWCNVIDSQVWKIKLSRVSVPVQKINTLPWFACFWILLKSPLNRNLLKNNCGQEGIQYWDILSSGGDGWAIEKPPHGCDDFPKECNDEDVLNHNSCFMTSFYSCTKRQIVDLKEEGATQEFMDIVQPHITVADWYCGRMDCRAIYEFKVKLLNENFEPLDDFEIRKNVGGADGWSWQKVSHVFQSYGPGVKYIEFYHGGMDSQFWKGHYGSKMTGALISLSIP